tara:strand:+ start:521 stop:1438 length:918 start_codon:yes stop_codon:yes gene_type:complete
MSEYHDLIDSNLIQGKFFFDKSLKNLTWLKVGGKASCLYIPKNKEDLAIFLKHIDSKVRISVFGRLSNVLIRDGGISGVTILIPPSFSELEIHKDNKITLGSGLLDKNVSQLAYDNGLGGFEFLSGIPGNIGGAIAMNAGCYGSEIKDITDEVLILERDGVLKSYNNEEMKFSYRNSVVKTDQIIIEATFQGRLENKSNIKEKIDAVVSSKEESQPSKVATGGSTFRNPKEVKAWELINSSGLSGYKIGGAMISPIHNNFFINTGNASAKDFEKLGEFVIHEVEKQHGIRLEWEIHLIGDTIDDI